MEQTSAGLSNVDLSPEGRSDLMTLATAAKAAEVRGDRRLARKLNEAMSSVINTLAAIDELIDTDEFESQTTAYHNRSRFYLHQFVTPPSSGIKATAFSFPCDGREGAMSEGRGVGAFNAAGKFVVFSIGLAHDAVYNRANARLRAVA